MPSNNAAETQIKYGVDKRIGGKDDHDGPVHPFSFIIGTKRDTYLEKKVFKLNNPKNTNLLVQQRKEQC